jgi:hypothetical protein
MELNGDEHLHGSGAPATGASALDFWRWAFGDLTQNALRGMFAEWLVATLLDEERTCRDPWAECDLITGYGLRLKVKTAAYRQSWHDEDSLPLKIVFSGLHGRRLENGSYVQESTYNADRYIFCLLLDNREPAADPFDLGNREFWTLDAAALGRATPNSANGGPIYSVASDERRGS